MKKVVLFFVSLFWTTLFLQAQEGTDDAVKRRRPTPFFDADHPIVHDPVMAFEDGRWYVFATGMGISVMSSADLKTWKQEKPVFQKAPQWAVDLIPGYRGHTWAPDIQRVNGLWYLYYSCSTFGKNNSAIGLAVNRTLNPESPDYQWEDRGLVVRSRRLVDNWNAIDPNLILDKHGCPWLTWGSFWDGIQLQQLSADFQTPTGKVRTVARKWNPDAVKEEGVEANNNEIEAPFIIRHGKYYYLFASTGLCCRGLKSTYRTVVGRSKRITGPYRDKDGKKMLKGGGTLVLGGDAEYAGIGHCGLAQDAEGQWYIIAHGYSRADNGASKMVLRRLDFVNGWPAVK